MVLLIIIPFLNGYFIGGIPYFQTNPTAVCYISATVTTTQKFWTVEKYVKLFRTCFAFRLKKSSRRDEINQCGFCSRYQQPHKAVQCLHRSVAVILVAMNINEHQ